MSAKNRTVSGALGGLLGFIGMSAVAGVLVTVAVTPALAVTGMTATNTINVFESLPNYLKVDELAQKSTIYAVNSDGTPLALASFYDQNRVEVPLEAMSPAVQDAAVSGEDPRFYEHGGVDLQGTVRGALSTVTGGGTQGGSSITQQYVKNVLVQKCEVLTGDSGILHELAHAVDRYFDPVLVVERGQGERGAVAVEGVDGALLGELVHLEVVGQVLEHVDRVGGRHARYGESGGHGDGDENTGDGAHPDKGQEAAEGSTNRTIFGRHTIERKGQNLKNRLNRSRMTAWEYLTTPLMIHNTAAILNNWGSEGWELVQVVTGPEGGLVAYLKRPVAGPEGA